MNLYRKGICIGIVAVVGAGCSSSSNSSGTPPATTTTTPTTDAVVVTNNLTKTLPWNSLLGKANINAYIRGAESGETVLQRPIKIVSAYSEAGEDVFTMLANGTDVYGPGDSGSPVVMADGTVIGALFAGDDPQHLYGVSITQEMTAAQMPGTKRASTPTSSAGPAPWGPKQWFFVGPAGDMPLVTKKGPFSLTHYIGGPPGGAAPTTKPATAPTVIPGTRYASAILYGPQADLYVAATYSYQVSPTRWVATGHAIEGNGPAKWPVFPDYVDFVETDGTVESHLNGPAFGTLLYDGPFGSLIDTSKVPQVLPVTVNITLNGTTSPAVTHYTVLDRGSSYEEEGVDIGAATPVVTAVGTYGGEVTGNASIVIYQGGKPTTYLFPDNGLGTVSTEGPESPASFYDDLEFAVDTAWATNYTGDPTTQIEKVVVNVTMTESAFSPITGK